MKMLCCVSVPFKSMSMPVLVLYKSTESVKHFQWQIQDITGGANPNGVYQNNIAPNVSKPAWNEENWAGGMRPKFVYVNPTLILNHKCFRTIISMV